MEAGERLFSGCSSRTGLTKCATLLLDPCELVNIDVKQFNPSVVKSHQPVDIFQVEKKKVGRKQIYKDLCMYFNYNDYSIIIPKEMLIRIGSPKNIELLWDKKEYRLLIRRIDKQHRNSFKASSVVYDDMVDALTLPKSDLFDEVKEKLQWKNTLIEVKCNIIKDQNDDLLIICNLNESKSSKVDIDKLIVCK